MAINKWTGATNSSWSFATNWSLGVVPTSSDGHITTFDATSPACTVNGGIRQANAIDFSGYTNTITMTFGLQILGNITLGASMGISGTGALTPSATSTLTSNGKTWPNDLSITSGASSTITLADNWTVLGTVTNNASLVTINGNTLYCNGNITWTQQASIGTTTFVVNGAGIITTAGTFRNNLTINSTSTPIFSGNIFFTSATLQILTPCVVSDAVLNIATSATTTIIDTPFSLVGGWKGLTISNSAGNTAQFNSPFYTYNTATLGSSTQTLTINGSDIYVISGTLTSAAGNNGSVTGTSSIRMVGDSATISDNTTSGNSGVVTWALPIIVDIRGVLLMIGHLRFSSGASFSILNGNVVNRPSVRNIPTLTVTNSMTLTNVHKCKFSTISISSNQTLTMNEFFTGSPDNKSVIRVTGGSTNYKIAFTDTAPKKAFFVNVKNCTVQTTSNQLNIIGRDSNSGLNSGIIFGESGLDGFPLNKYGTENSYSFIDGFLQRGLNN